MTTGKHLKAAILARRAAKGPRKKRTRPGILGSTPLPTWSAHETG